MSKRSYVATGVTDSGECDAVVVDEAAVRRARDLVADGVRLKALADIFGALSDPTRLRILLALASGPLCVCDLSAVTGVSQSGVSHQLRVLRDLDLVTFVRDGRRAVYSLADAHVETLLAQGAEHADERGRGR